MRVTMELNEGEILLCDNCSNLFYGDAVLDIDDADKSVEAVYCVPCVVQSSISKAKREERIEK